MLDDLHLGVVGHEIVVLIVPAHSEGTHDIEGSIPAVTLLLFHRVLKIVELDLLVLGDTVMDRIHIVIDGLVSRLHAVPDEDLSVQQLCLMDTGQLLDLPDQSVRLLPSNKLRGLN